MKPEEKLRAMLRGYKIGIETGAGDDHLRDEDFLRLIEAESSSAVNAASKTNGNSDAAAVAADLAFFRRHLANCDECLAKFQDYYAFYASAENDDPVAAKSETDAAWRAFAPRISDTETNAVEEKRSFRARLFPAERKMNYFAAFGWGFAALLLAFSLVSVFIAYRAKTENSQLAEQIEKQKQINEERLKTVEASAQNRDLAEQEKTALAAEKDALQKQIAKLQTELERAKQPIAVGDLTPPKNPGANLPPVADDSLIAVNTPIYDVFPADSAVRGSNQPQNNLNVPRGAESIVLILNAAGRADYPSYRAELSDGAGKIIWRGAGLKKDDLGNFTFTLSRAGLKTGVYRLRLLGKNESGTQAVAEYQLTIAVK